MSNTNKLAGSLERKLKSDEHKNTGVAGWNGAQYIFEGGVNGRSVAYMTPEELAPALPAEIRKDMKPERVSSHLQGRTLTFAFVVSK